MQSRRSFLKAACAAPLALSAGCAGMTEGGARAGRGALRARPNVVLIMTDDHGYGDLSCHGNPVLRTPNLDRLHDEGVRFSSFHVSPVCSPTRSSLMTGRYTYRTGIVDTFQGRSMMRPDEITIAELLAADGYHTGIFGKWHLGDNYPMRAMDQGFEESLVHKGGGICQPSEPRNNTYFDPVLKKNGSDVQCKGYCSDIFTDATLDFIRRHADEPFFAYLAFNAPHEPLIVDDRYATPYRGQVDEKTAKVYGMIANADENVGRVLDLLRSLGMEENTIVIFLTDNGAFLGKDAERFNAGLRGQKGTVYEGGLRVPFFLRWPSGVSGGTTVDRLAAHIDVLPTLLDACGVAKPAELALDGRSLVPAMRGNATDWPDRTLFFQWHRGDVPRLYENCAAITQQYKLVNGRELYDLAADPGEQHDAAARHPEIVSRLRAEYEAWFADVGKPNGYAPPRICIGSRHENPAVLTRQDWRGAESWHDGNYGYWEVDVARGGRFTVSAEFPETDAAARACFALSGAQAYLDVPPQTSQVVFRGVRIQAGPGRLEIWTERQGKREGPRTVSIEKHG